MHRMAKGQGGAAKKGLLYQKPLHFDLADIPAEHACEDRWSAIAAQLPEGSGAALDIGANLGFFSHALERAGFETTAVEYDPAIALAARRIATAEKRALRVIQGDILARQTLEMIGNREFSVVVAINIFHHFIKTEEGYNRLREFIRNIRAHVMIFEPHHPSDPQMSGGYANPSPDEFARLIVQWANLKRYEPIYDSADGRTIFKLA